MDNELEFEQWQEHCDKRAWRVGALCLLVLFAYLPLGALLGWARFLPGLRWRMGGAGITLGFYLPLLCALVYTALLSPLLRSGFLKVGEKPERLVLALALWGLPLLSFAYWLGDFKNSLHAYDLAVFLIGALGVPLVLFWRTGTVPVLSLGVSLAAFVPLFLIEDILGPFNPLFVYASEGPGIYSLRTLCVAAALSLAALVSVPRWGKARGREELLRLFYLVLACASMGLNLGAWWSGETGIYHPEWNWVGYLGLLYFLRRPDAFGRKAFLGVSAVQFLALVAQGSYLVWAGDGGLGPQTRLLLVALGSVLVATEGRRRGKRFSSSRMGGLRRSSPAHPENQSGLPTSQPA